MNPSEAEPTLENWKAEALKRREEITELKEELKISELAATTEADHADELLHDFKSLQENRNKLVKKLKIAEDILKEIWHEGVCAGELKDKVADVMEKLENTNN